MVSLTLSSKQRSADMNAKDTSPAKVGVRSASFVRSHRKRGLTLKQLQKGLFGSPKERRGDVNVRTPPATPDAESLALPTLRVSIVAEPKQWALPQLDGSVFSDSVRSVGQSSTVFSDLTNTETATCNAKKHEPSASHATAYLRNVLNVCVSKGKPTTPEGNAAAGTHLPLWGMAPSLDFSDSDGHHLDDDSAYRSESSVYYDNIECILEGVATHANNKQAQKIEEEDALSEAELLTSPVERHGLHDTQPAAKQMICPSPHGNAVEDTNVLTTAFGEGVILCQLCAPETDDSHLHKDQPSVHSAAESSEKKVSEDAGGEHSVEIHYKNFIPDPDDTNKTHRPFYKPRRVFSLLKLNQLFKTRPFGFKKQQPGRKSHQEQHDEADEEPCPDGAATEDVTCEDDESLFIGIENVETASLDNPQDKRTSSDASPFVTTGGNDIIAEPDVESEASTFAAADIDSNVENTALIGKRRKLYKPKLFFAPKLPKIHRKLILTRNFNKGVTSKQEAEQPQSLFDTRNTINHPRQKGIKRGHWKAVTDDMSGKMYFYHTITKETSWERPLDFLEWRAKKDPASGNVYFYNVLSKETTWEKPAEFVEWKAVLDKASGETYYYNVITKETTWDTPDGFKVTDIRAERQLFMQDEHKEEQKQELALQQVCQELEAEEENENEEYDIFEATSTPRDEPYNTTQEIMAISKAVEPAVPSGLKDILSKHSLAPVLRTNLTKSIPDLDKPELSGQFTPEFERLAMLLAEHSPKNGDNNVQLLRQLKKNEKIVLKQLETLLEDTPFDELEQVVSSFVNSKIESGTNDGDIPIIASSSAKSAKFGFSSTTTEATAPPPVDSASVQSAQSHSMNSQVMTPAEEVSMASRCSTHRLTSRVMSQATGIVSHNTGVLSETTDHVNNTTTDVSIKPSHGMVVITDIKEEKAAVLTEGSFVATDLDEGSFTNADKESTTKTVEVSVKEEEEKDIPLQPLISVERDRTLQAENLAGRAEDFSGWNKSRSKGSSMEGIVETAGETANTEDAGDWGDDVSELSVSVGPAFKRQKQKVMMLRKKEAQKNKNIQDGGVQSADSQKAGSQNSTFADDNGESSDANMRSYDRYYSDRTQNDGKQKEWTQTELDQFISQNDWDNVAKYVAKVRRESPTEPELDPHVQTKVKKLPSFAPSTASLNYALLPSQSAPRKRFGARSQLQHDEIDNSSEDDESSWDDGTVTTRSEYTDDESKSHNCSACSSVASSRRGDESSRDESTGKSRQILGSSRRNSRYGGSFQV